MHSFGPGQPIYEALSDSLAQQLHGHHAPNGRGDAARFERPTSAVGQIPPRDSAVHQPPPHQKCRALATGLAWLAGGSARPKRRLRRGPMTPTDILSPPAFWRRCPESCTGFTTPATAPPPPKRLRISATQVRLAPPLIPPADSTPPATDSPAQSSPYAASPPADLQWPWQSRPVPRRRRRRRRPRARSIRPPRKGRQTNPWTKVASRGSARPAALRGLVA